jgi:phosphocarrier protein HPr
MASVTIRLNSIGEVKEFNRIAATVPGDVDLHSGRYCVDAKSIMGIFSLDLSKPINLNVHAEGNNLDEVLKVLAPYIID